jgi:Predicted hydrolases of HD superfamily
MTSPTLNLTERSRMQRLTDFLFEAGMLKKTPRSGYQFLGTGSENVAEHSFRTAIIGYILAKEAGADIARTTMLCLFHDLPEARTGDFNYVNRMYNRTDPKLALEHATFGTGLTDELIDMLSELEMEESQEAKLAHDADQIDLILNLKEELDLGNKYAAKWIEGSLGRLVTDEGKALAKTITETDHTDWWYSGPDPKWWVKGR